MLPADREAGDVAVFQGIGVLLHHTGVMYFFYNHTKKCKNKSKMEQQPATPEGNSG